MVIERRKERRTEPASDFGPPNRAACGMRHAVLHAMPRGGEGWRAEGGGYEYSVEAMNGLVCDNDSFSLCSNTCGMSRR